MTSPYWVLTHLPESPSLPILANGAKTLGLGLRVIEPKDVSTALSQGRPMGVMTRIGSSAPNEALVAVRQIEDEGIFCANRSRPITNARDKSASQKILESHQIPCPQMIEVRTKGDVSLVRPHLGEPPWVVKVPISCKGVGVQLVSNEKSLSALLVPAEESQLLIVQKFVAESKGSDTRVLVVGGKALAAVRRVAQAGEFRSNVFLGGKAEKVTLDPATVEIAERSAIAMDLEIAGVDIIDSNTGPLVIEVNAAPGLHATQATNTIDLGSEILSFLQQRATQHSS